MLTNWWRQQQQATGERAGVVSHLRLVADAGDQGAAGLLTQWFQADPRLHPGGRIGRHDPFGGPAVVENLTPTG